MLSPCGFALSLLLTASPSPPAPSPAAAPARAGDHWLVQKDGTALRLATAPVRKGNRWVAKLAATGELISVRAEDVDDARTADANRPGGAPTPTATVVPTATPRLPGAAPRLGDSTKLSGSRKEIEQKLQSTKVAPTPRPGEYTPTPTPPPPGGQVRKSKGKADAELAEAGEHRDRNGRGEDYWRRRAGRVRSELERAEGQLEAARTDLREHELGTGGASAPVSQKSWARTLQKQRDKVRDAERKLARVQQDFEALRDEARRADAYPGWLR